MRYPFLENNQLMLVDYIPGSSGQLLMRLWSELDPYMQYDNPRDFTETTIGDHPASAEVDYDTIVPKKVVNWYLDRCDPSSVDDHLAFLETISTVLLSMRYRWTHGSGKKFYETAGYVMEGERVIYGMHTWGKSLPIKQMQAWGYGVRSVSIVPATDRGRKYQYQRAQICYPGDQNGWMRSIDEFNSKQHLNTIDLCTMLVDRNSDAIIEWLGNNVGDIREDKVARAKDLLDLYYHNNS